MGDEQGSIAEDQGVRRLDEAQTDDERLAIEAELLVQTDNRPRPEDGEQPSQAPEAGGASFAPAGSVLSRILDRARSELGVHEDPWGSNRTPYSEWYGMIGPWCAMFVSWCFFHEDLPLPATISRGFAYTPYGAGWFQARRRWATTPQAGAVVFFDFPGDAYDRISHVGIVEAVLPNGFVQCLEGNTNPAGGRTGGEVMRHVRKVGIVGYGLPDYPEGLILARATGGQPILREDSRGADVAEWQRHLNAASGSRVAVDGVFGPDTVAGTVAFQRAHRLDPDGEVGPDTRAAMAAVLASPPPAKAPIVRLPAFPGQVLRPGMRGPAVMTWQAQMSKRGWRLEVDGVFGPLTEDACRRFQSEKGMSVDGAIGRDTWDGAFTLPLS